MFLYGKKLPIHKTDTRNSELTLLLTIEKKPKKPNLQTNLTFVGDVNWSRVGSALFYVFTVKLELTEY